MKRLYSSLIEFLKPKIRPGSIFRGIGVLTFSMGTATGVIYSNYLGHWKGTIYRTQTVDFNILANLLPGKVSSQLLNNDTKGLQKTLDSNYGLFGIIITNCKSIEISCPTQKIIYASKVRVKKIDDYKRMLVSKDSYTKTWLRKFDNVDSPEEKLGSELFIPLYNPPSIEQMWEFTTPRESQIVYTRKKNQGEIIGRIYLLRANPPLFTEELGQWLQNPLSTSSKTLVYNAIAITALFTGLFVWLLSELIYHLKLETEKRLRTLAENEARILKEKIEAEEAVQIADRYLHIAVENESKAVREKLDTEQKLRLTVIKSEQAVRGKQEAEKIARVAAQKSEQAIREKQEAEQIAQQSEQAIREKQEAEQIARVALQKSEQAIQEKQEAEQIASVAAQKSEQAIQEKQEAEQIARVATQKSEQAIREKQEAEEAAQIAIREREEARRDASYLYDSIQEPTRELVRKDEDLRTENSQQQFHPNFEVIQLSKLPLTLDIAIQHRNFFEWIDSELRTTHDVESWLMSRPELRSLVKDNSNGQTSLNALGTLLYCAVNEILADRPRVKWPHGVAFPPSEKNSVSAVEHRRPRGWERIVNRLCEIDCVTRVAYDEAAYGGSVVKVLDAESGTIAARYGSAGLFLPLRIETTARGKAQIELVIEYIHRRIL
jgi:hypothetical protein